MTKVETHGGGGIESCGPGYLENTITTNFTERGIAAGHLLRVALTETPYTPVIDGTRFEAALPGYDSAGDEDTAPVSDTVQEAKEALAEFVHADVPGARRLSLSSHRTHYRTMMRRVSPTRRDDQRYVDAFDEAMVETSRSHGIALATPDQARAIIAGAPRRLLAFPLGEHSFGLGVYDEQSHDAVTAAGHIIRTTSVLNNTLYCTWYRSLSRLYLSDNIEMREAKSPSPDIIGRIRDRATALRTKHSKR